MKIADFNRLKKLMAATTSDNDGEALNALRAANKILAAEPTDWQRVLDRTMKVMDPVEAGPTDAHTSDPEMDLAFASIDNYGNLRGNFADLIESIRDQYRSGKKLSPRQREVVMNASLDARSNR